MKQAVKFTVYTLVILPCLLLSACMVPRETIDFSNIKTITAALWLKVTDYPKAMLEGPAFDRNGDLYFCDTHYEVTEGGGKIYKVSLADKLVKTIYDDPDHSGFASIKIHKDGRLFLCGFYSGDIVIMNPDGTGKKVLTASYKGRKLIPDDMIFDNDGNFYFTDYSGEIWDPTGGVYRVPSDLSSIDLVYKGLAKGNGVSLSPDGKQLWVAETYWTGQFGLYGVLTWKSKIKRPVSWHRQRFIVSLTEPVGLIRTRWILMEMYTRPCQAEEGSSS